MKVGHRQAPNKRKPDSKESGFFASGAVSQVGWVERSETQHNPCEPLHNSMVKKLLKCLPGWRSVKRLISPCANSSFINELYLFIVHDELPHCWVSLRSTQPTPDPQTLLFLARIFPLANFTLATR